MIQHIKCKREGQIKHNKKVKLIISILNVLRRGKSRNKQEKKKAKLEI